MEVGQTLGALVGRSYVAWLGAVAAALWSITAWSAMSERASGGDDTTLANDLLGVVVAVAVLFAVGFVAHIACRLGPLAPLVAMGIVSAVEAPALYVEPMQGAAFVVIPLAPFLAVSLTRVVGRRGRLVLGVVAVLCCLPLAFTLTGMAAELGA
ncbi:MAG: hypothetical protein QM572_19405 [Nocardioides sp.]|uniref:hypothetical protein n=1 Tax=Nocardioides sp. TaxID=35761 RepID=UPI0039E266A2